MRTLFVAPALLLAAAGLMPLPAAAEPDPAPRIQLAQNRPASPSCDSQRKACYAGAAQETTFGGRYVPVEAVRMCEEAYRDCTRRR